MNGAQSLCDTLLAHDIDVCFANPGTSEMHFVAALDRRPEMRCILGLFEGVVTAAADGYTRMSGKPAATLLHLGPGLANGLANLHNAKRARTPMVNVVGEHATWHIADNAPLTSDIESLARPMSDWVHRLMPGESVADATVAAVEAAWRHPGIATLILPADVAWSDETPGRRERHVPRPPPPATGQAVDAVARLLRDPGRKVGLLLAGASLTPRGLAAAERIAARTGCRLVCEMFNPRIARGRGLPVVPKVPYVVEAALGFLHDIDVMVLVGARIPVAFFGYPNKPGRLHRPDCDLVTLADPDRDLEASLEAVEEAVGARGLRALTPSAALPEEPQDGTLTGDAISAIVARRLPEGAVLVDEALTAGWQLFPFTQGAAPHDYLQLTGGSIGIGIPLAAGAAVGAPGRKVVAIQADGSGMYTVQGLWTQAREQLDVVTVILSNRAYAILHGEMKNVGVNEIGRNAARMFNLDQPDLDWVALAKGMGVAGERVDTVAGFARAFDAALREPGPRLIEAVI